MILLSSIGDLLWQLAPYYLAVEVVFYLVFHRYMVPRANQLVTPIPYRDYGDERVGLLKRIFARLVAKAQRENEDVAVALHRLLLEYFQVTPNPNHHRQSSHTNLPQLIKATSCAVENSDDDDSSSEDSRLSSLKQRSSSTISEASQEPTATTSAPDICLYKEDVDKLFAWTFFGKFPHDLCDWEVQQLDQIYRHLQAESNILFPPKPIGKSQQSTEIKHFLEPRRMTLEPMRALHRPLAVYLLVSLAKFVGGLVLRFMGFQRMVASTGLVGWYRPAKLSSEGATPLSPLIFFHGIAPAGHILYLPMFLRGLATEAERPSFIFENRGISCTMDFAPLTEEETVDGVLEILDRSGCSDQPLSVVGHSFGSCTATWLIARARETKQIDIRHVVLLDPVSILLSEPDVLLNFLYGHEFNHLRLVASSELFTEFFLRRKFAFYNSELWLDDLDHKNSSLLVCVSQEDQILNATKVKSEVDRYSTSTQFAQQPVSVYWEGVAHGACVTSPQKWQEIKSIMLQQELDFAQRR